jgi:hypothetical protein
MEPEGSLPHSQEPATCPYPGPDWSSPCPPPSNLSKIHFNVILPSTPGSVWFRGCVWYFVTWLIFYGEELLVPCQTSKLEDHPLSAVSDCLLNIFAATLRICRLFLHAQPEDAPFRGDRDSLIAERSWYVVYKYASHRRCIPVSFPPTQV